MNTRHSWALIVKRQPEVRIGGQARSDDEERELMLAVTIIELSHRLKLSRRLRSHRYGHRQRGPTVRSSQAMGRSSQRSP